jgi:lysophospholipase L1-like esterase
MIITDSVAMPRFEVPYEHTWIGLMKQRFSGDDIIDRPARGSTSLRLVTEGGGGVDLLENYRPDLVILQLGITECAPRLFKKTGVEYFIMNRIMSPRARQRYIDRVKQRRTRDPNLTETPPHQFRHNLNAYLCRAGVCGAGVIVLPIFRPTPNLVTRSPFIGENIATYNRIMKEVVAAHAHAAVVEVFDKSFPMEKVSVDGIHINREGSRMVFEKVAAAVNDIFDRRSG